MSWVPQQAAVLTAPARRPHPSRLASRTAMVARAMNGGETASSHGTSYAVGRVGVAGAKAAMTRRAMVLTAGTVACVTAWATPARADFDFSLLPNVDASGGPPKGVWTQRARTWTRSKPDSILACLCCLYGLPGGSRAHTQSSSDEVLVCHAARPTRHGMRRACRPDSDRIATACWVPLGLARAGGRCCRERRRTRSPWRCLCGLAGRCSAQKPIPLSQLEQSSEPAE
jgi:hypothetical protein